MKKQEMILKAIEDLKAWQEGQASNTRFQSGFRRGLAIGLNWLEDIRDTVED